MLLYIYYKDKLTNWKLSEDNTSRVTSDIFDNDIYCEEVKSEFKLKLLANQNVEFTFFKPLKQLTLASGEHNQPILGNFCSLNDCWLNLASTRLVLSQAELNFTKDGLTELEEKLRNNWAYRVSAAINPVPDAAAVVVEAENAAAHEANQHNDNLELAEAAELDPPEIDQPAQLVADSEPAGAEPAGLLSDEPLKTTPQLDAQLARAKQAKKLKRGLKVRLGHHWRKIQESELYSELDRFRPYLLRIKQFMRKHLLFTIIGLALLLLLLIIFVIVKLTMTVSENTSLSAQSHYYERSIDQDKKVKDALRSYQIVNLNIYKEYDRYMISGLIMDGRQVAKVASQIKVALQNLRMELNLVSFNDVETALNEIENDYELSCSLAKNFASVKCTGTVSDKDSVKDQVLAKYPYNSVLPLVFNLLYKSDIENLINSLLADKTLYRNVKYQLQDNQLTLSGYIEKFKIAGLNSALLLFLERMPFIKVENKLKIIEQEINLRVQQIIFNDYGNSLVDEQGQLYNVGSKFKNFTITAITKNTITLQQNSNLIILYTPFNTDSLPDLPETLKLGSSDKVVNGDFTQSISQAVDGALMMVPPIVASSPAPVVKQTIAQGIAEVNEKNLILKELTKAQLSNTNPTLKQSYDNLIFNVNSDIITQQKQLAAQRPLKP